MTNVIDLDARRRARQAAREAKLFAPLIEAGLFVDPCETFDHYDMIQMQIAEAFRIPLEEL